MSQDRPLRVPRRFAAETLRRLQQRGDLAILIGILLDHADSLDTLLRAKLGKVLLTDAEQLAAFQRDQGALAEVQKIARVWETQGQPESAGNPRADEAEIQAPRRALAT